jgi:hypothetical protein
MLISGLPSVSAYRILVSVRIARRKFSGSSGATNVVSTPSFFRFTPSRVCVPP